MKRAEELGLVLSEKDVEAAKRLKVETAILHAELEGLALTVGKTVIPLITNLTAVLEAWFRRQSTVPLGWL